MTRLEELEKEQRELGLDKTDREIEKRFTQLSKYSDVQGTPNLKAKLCLLVFSLPLYELCETSMQDAAKVFIERNFSFAIRPTILKKPTN